MRNDSNIGYWEQVLQAPTQAYKELFDAEQTYLLDKIKPGMHVLDIGCGEGRNIRTFLQRTEKVDGLDMDEKAVRDAQNNFRDIPTVKITIGEASNLPFKDGSFDIVALLMILPNLDTQKEKAMREAARVLKDDGALILSTFAETAFDERMKIYNQVKAPIVKIEGTKFIFDKSLGANVSEQFSISEIETLAKQAGLRISDHNKIGNLAYICTLVKV